MGTQHKHLRAVAPKGAMKRRVEVGEADKSASYGCRLAGGMDPGAFDPGKECLAIVGLDAAGATELAAALARALDMRLVTPADTDGQRGFPGPGLVAAVPQNMVDGPEVGPRLAEEATVVYLMVDAPALLSAREARGEVADEAWRERLAADIVRLEPVFFSAARHVLVAGARDLDTLTREALAALGLKPVPADDLPDLPA